MTGPNERYMQAANKSLAAQKKTQVVQELEARMKRMRIRLMEKQSQALTTRYKQLQKKLRDNLEKNVAYQLVLEDHSIERAPSFNKALELKYTYDALKPKVMNMMERLQPSYIREQKAKIRLEQSRKKQEEVIERNLNYTRLLPLENDKEKERRQKDRKRKNSEFPDDFYLTSMNKNEACIDFQLYSSTRGLVRQSLANIYQGDSVFIDTSNVFTRQPEEVKKEDTTQVTPKFQRDTLTKLPNIEKTKSKRKREISEESKSAEMSDMEETEEESNPIDFKILRRVSKGDIPLLSHLVPKKTDRPKDDRPKTRHALPPVKVHKKFVQGHT